jgi:tRNA-specific 2-thiouridylase
VKKYLDNGDIIVRYSQGVKAVTPGQACVFYLNEECLGGGIIKEVRKNNQKLWYL